MLTVIYGGVGNGKTLLLTVIGYYAKKEVVANYQLRYPNKKIEEFSLTTFLKTDYKNKCLLLDEAYIYLESRLSMKQKNRLSSYVLFQSRKKDVNMYLTAQLINTIDIRYRKMIDYVIKCNGVVGNAYQYICCNNQTKIIKVKYIMVDAVKQFYKYFDTNQVISDEEMIKNAYKTAKENRMMVDKVVKDLIQYYIKNKKKKRITMDMVNLYMFDNEINQRFAKTIYTKLKVNHSMYVKS